MTPGADHPDTQLAAGNALMQAGRFADAAAAYQRALTHNPASPHTHNNLAVAFAQQHLFDQAIASYGQALRLDPNYADAHFNLGNAMHALARHADAVACYDRALKLNPGWPSALLNRGLVFASQGRQALAEANYRAALAGRPDHPEAHNNLGLALQLQGQLDEAMSHFDRALALAPEFAGAHANRAQLRLLRGELQSGWPEYEWRWRLANMSLPALNIPRWDGKLHRGLTLLLRAEQGLGDTLQFVRFALPLQRAGLRVIIECQPALASLLGRASGVQAAVMRTAALPQCDAQIPIASLPGVLGVFDTAAIPADTPYLQADPKRVAQWRDTLAPHTGFKIGIVWRGSPGYPHDRHRSIPAESFGALATVPGVTLVSLQFGQRVPQGLHAVQLDHLDAGQPSFEDTAAVLANLDLIVTCDTAIGHLAGALGKPVWIALPLIPDWRWLLGRDDSPWYPTVRLFRQTRLDDWAPVFDRIQVALMQRLAQTTDHDNPPAPP